MTTQKKNESIKVSSEKEEVQSQPTETVELQVVSQNENALQLVNRKTANDVFERLEQGNRMKEGFNKFKEKLDVCEKFANNYNNEALCMTIQNIGTGDELEIQNIHLILEFVEEKLVKAGKNHLKQLEEQIINFSL